MQSKKLAAIGVSAGLLAGGAAGLVLTVPGLSGATTTEDTTVTSDSGTDSTTETADKIRPDPGTFLADTLAPLVTDGTLTQAQADAVIAALQDARPPFGGHGPGGHGVGFGVKLDTAATALGLTVDELREALQADDTSLADVAAAQGVDVQTLIDALVADATTRLDEKVADGDLTQAEADEKLADLTERITEMVNNDDLGDHGPGRGGFRMRGPRPADDEATADSSGS